MEPQRIYEVLKEQIIWQELPPESLINLNELSQIHEVSRTPIKEALIILQAEGWVLRHGSHFMVTPLTLDRIKEISEFRYIMEPQAYARAIYRLSREELKVLGRIREEISGLKGRVERRKAIDLDLEFHLTMFRATGNRLFAEQLERLLFHYLRFWLSADREIEIGSYFAGILEMVEAVEKRDAEGIKEAGIKHIDMSLESEIRNLLSKDNRMVRRS